MANEPIIQSGLLSPKTYPNRFLAMIPPEAPFFRRSLKVMLLDDNDKPVRQLIEGLDYQLGYYYLEASHQIGDDIFGGILLKDTTIETVRYEFEQVGRAYQIPKSEISRVLVAVDMESPLNVDWSQLMRFVPTVPAVDPPKNLEEAIERDRIVAAIHSLATKTEASAKALNAKYEVVRSDLEKNGVRIFSEGLYQHHLISDAHHYTAKDIGALTRKDTAVNSEKAFGFTFDELLDIYKRSHIQKLHIDRLFNRSDVLKLRGPLQIEKGGSLLLRNSSGKASLSVKDRDIVFTSSKDIVLRSDKSSKNAKSGSSYAAGFNKLLLSSDPIAKAPILNGSYLVVGDDVKEYIKEPVSLSRRAYVGSSSTLVGQGNGTSASAISFTAKAPEANAVVKGLTKITELVTVVTPGYGISQNAVTTMRDNLAMYVPSTYTINGKKFDAEQRISLTATDLSLGNVDNTAPADKPASEAFIAELELKAPTTHTHQPKDLENKVAASETDEGLMYLNEELGNTPYAATSDSGLVIKTRYDKNIDKINAIVPVWATLPEGVDGRKLNNVRHLITHEADSNAHGEIAEWRATLSRLWLLKNITVKPKTVGGYYKAEDLETPNSQYFDPRSDSTLTSTDTDDFITSVKVGLDLSVSESGQSFEFDNAVNASALRVVSIVAHPELDTRVYAKRGMGNNVYFLVKITAGEAGGTLAFRVGDEVFDFTVTGNETKIEMVSVHDVLEDKDVIVTASPGVKFSVRRGVTAEPGGAVDENGKYIGDVGADTTNLFNVGENNCYLIGTIEGDAENAYHVSVLADAPYYANDGRVFYPYNSSKGLRLFFGTAIPEILQTYY